MTLIILWFLIAGFNFHWGWYIATAALWVIARPLRKLVRKAAEALEKDHEAEHAGTTNNTGPKGYPNR